MTTTRKIPDHESNYLTVEPHNGLMYVSAENTDGTYVPVILFPREARELIAQLTTAIAVSEGDSK